MMPHLWPAFIALWLLLSWASGYTTLSDESLQSLPEPGKDFDIHNGALLAPILQPRVPGTEGSAAVLAHFVDFFRKQLPEWRVEFQNSTSKTPATGSQDVPFVNLIATRDPPWTKPGDVGRLALVAHYDSKMTPEGFIGATDSAAPCAMIMHAVRSLDKALTRKWTAMQAENEGLDYADVEEHQGIQVILLDGEEAFKSWTDTDSLYGARALAEFWEQTSHPAMSTYQTPLSSISLFLLLDLLGSENPTIPSYFRTTHWAYKAMSTIETRLRSLKQFKSSPNHPEKRKRSAENQNAPRQEPVFLVDANKKDDRFRGWMMQDDHIPFMARGVEVLHMIPSPFPIVWHKMEDDGEHLDLDTTEDWAKLVAAFAAEWLDLEGYMLTAAASHDKPRDGANKERRNERSVTSKTEL